MNNFVKLGELLKITSGGTPSRKNQSYYKHGDIPWVKTGDLKTKYIEDTPEKITALGLEKSSAKIFPPRTVLIAMYGATIGNCAILKVSASSNQACAAFLPNNNINEEYLYYYLKSIKKYFISRGQGGGQPNISGKILKNTKIPLIPLEQQIRIATLLSRAEELITKRKKSIRLLDDLLKSTFLEMFGNSHISKEKWGVENLGNYITFLTSGSRGWAKYYSDTGKIFLRIQNVENARLKLDDVIRVLPPDSAEAKRTKVREGDLLLSITADLGRTAVVPKGFEEAHINQHLALIRLKTQLDPVFTAFFYSTPFGQSIIRKYDRVGVKSGLNFNDIKKMKIIVPPKKIQIKFTEIFYKVDSLKAKYETSLQELENLYGSLSQRAFRGELDVSKVPIHHEIEVHDTVLVQEVDSPTIVIEKGEKFELNIKSIQELISGNFTKPFTFAMLWEQINTMLLDQEADEEKETPAEGEELHNYETVQQLIYTMLNGSNPFLKQIFSQDGEQKEIVLELAR